MESLQQLQQLVDGAKDKLDSATYLGLMTNLQNLYREICKDSEQVFTNKGIRTTILKGSLLRREWLDSQGRKHRDDDKPAEIMYFENGNIWSEGWYINGQRRRDGDKPAVIYYYENGVIENQSTWGSDGIEHCVWYYEDGNIQREVWTDSFHKPHRDGDKPAGIQYYLNGNIKCEHWDQHGNHYRESDKPAVIWYYENGNIQSKCWCNNGKGYRDREGDKPAYIEYWPDGHLRRELWYKDGELNREEDKPAHIEYWENGKVREEQWFKDDDLYRDGDKPTVVKYTYDGELKCKRVVQGWEISQVGILKNIDNLKYER